MPTFKLYSILGLEKSSSHDQIKSAYRKLAIIHHPDKGGESEKFKEISSAYEVLGDSEKRKNYDMFGDEGPPPQQHAPDIFSHFFGGHHQQQFQEYTVTISLKESFFGCTKVINFTHGCSVCKINCENCQGTGRISNMIRNGFFTQILQNPCSSCSGRGNTKLENCQNCRDHKLVCEIKKGSFSQNIQISQDVIIKIIVEDDPIFKRNGDNLMFNNTITFMESIVGKVIQIPHFSGTFEFNTETFGIIDPTKEYIINGKGMTDTGKLVIKFTIIYPSKEEEVKIREALTK